MDPVSAIGFVGSVLGIVDLVSKGAAALSELREKYRIADLKVNLLIGQLFTLSTALNQVAHILGGHPDLPQDEQLVRGLSTSLACVESVILVLDERLDPLLRNSADGLSPMGKFNFLWDESTFKDYQSLLNNQVNAMNLLLTALQCRTTFEQKRLLETDESRNLLVRIKDDTSSLLLLRDTESARTRRSVWSQDVSTFGTDFVFDQEIFNSRVYRMAIRSNMMHALLLDTQEDTASIRHAHIDSSRAADLPLNRDRSAMNRTATAPPRLNHRPFHPEITVTHELHRFSRSFDSSMDLEQSTPTTGITATSSSQSQEGGAQDQGRTFYVQSSPKMSTASETDFIPPHLQVLLEPSSRDADSDLWSLNTTGSQSYIERPFTATASHRRTVSTLPAIPQGRVTQASAKTQKVLILGVKGSGKSTLIKSLNVAHGQYDEAWRLMHNESIYGDFLASLEQLISEVINFQHEQVDPHEDLRHLTEKTEALLAQVGILRRDLCNDMTVSAVRDFCTDDHVQSVLDRLQSRLDTPQISWMSDRDSVRLGHANHFLDSSSRILQPHYIPSDPDILRTYIKTTGIYESQYVVNGTPYKFVDVGGASSERRKWKFAFKDVSTIIFTFDVSFYHLDLSATGVETGSRTEAALGLWEDMLNLATFENTNFVAMFTKLDKLTRMKLRRSSIRNTYHYIQGDPEDPTNVLRHIKGRIKSVAERSTWAKERNASGRSIVFCCPMSITESTTDIAEVAFSAIQLANSKVPDRELVIEHESMRRPPA